MPRNQAEYELHKNVVEWLLWQKPDCVWFHPYNGAYMSKATAGKGKALGVLPGVADLVFVLLGDAYYGWAKVAFIELKAPGQSVSAVQKTFAADVDRLGAPYAVAHTIEEVQGILKAWGVTFAHARGRAA